jgi:AcrR family transcriptional regulator
MTSAQPRRDRRHGRRDETLAAIVDVAVQVMSEQGAGGLSLGEVARRMGMQTPSLYGYFASKHAVYDAVFARGWRDLLESVRAERPRIEAHADPAELLLALARHYVRWSVEHPAYSELMSWRPVPGYQPSAEAYAPAVETWAEAASLFARLQDSGRLRADVPADEQLRVWTILLTGVVSQQLSNAPGEGFDEGRFTSLLPDVVALFTDRYVPPPDSATERHP